MIAEHLRAEHADLAPLRHALGREPHAGAHARREVGGERAVDRDDVFLLVVVLGAQDLVDDVAVVREQDQALGLLVEPADREDSLGVIDEVDDVALDVALGRAGDADRLVERDVDRPLILRALPTRSPSTLTSSPVGDLVPRPGRGAVDRDAALLDQRVGLAPRPLAALARDTC